MGYERLFLFILLYFYLFYYMYSAVERFYSTILHVQQNVSIMYIKYRIVKKV